MQHDQTWGNAVECLKLCGLSGQKGFVCHLGQMWDLILEAFPNLNDSVVLSLTPQSRSGVCVCGMFLGQHRWGQLAAGSGENPLLIQQWHFRDVSSQPVGLQGNPWTGGSAGDPGGLSHTLGGAGPRSSGSVPQTPQKEKKGKMSKCVWRT